MMRVRPPRMLWQGAAVLCWSLLAGDAQPQDSGDQTPDLQYRIAMVSPAAGGVYIYRPGRWGLLNLTLTNTSDDDLELLCATYFDTEKTLQYGRRVWIPARSRLMISHPLRLPASGDQGTRYGIHTLMMEAEEGSETLVKDDSGKMELSNTLQSVSSGPVTGIVLPRHATDPIRGEVLAKDWVGALRIEQQFTKRLAYLGDELLPGEIEGLDALDQLVLADDRMLSDSAATAAIRRWVHGGGRLWIMLDRVDPRFPERLLGNEFACEVADRVSLTHLRFTENVPEQDPLVHEAEFEEPVEFVRVLPGTMQVDVLANGWPALLTSPYGAGQLLITTLASTAWVRPRGAADELRVQDQERWTGIISVPPGRRSFAKFFVPRPERPPVTAPLSAELGGYIGYAVPGRGGITAALAGFTIALCGAGFWLQRAGRLERLVWLTPALAILFGGGLVLAGRAQRAEIPPTAALLGIVQPVAGTEEATVEGVAGLYATDSGTMQLGGTRGGCAVPDLTGTGGAARRLIWSDLGVWQWEKLPQSPGLREAEYHWTGVLSEPLRARARFGPDGITGQLSVPPGLGPADALLATPTGRIAVELGNNGDFEARAAGVLRADQYLGAELLDDEQARRGRLLGQLLTDGSLFQGGSPLLLFWTGPWEQGLQLDEAAQVVGTSLVAIPLVLERPEPGAEVLLPQPLLSYREATGPDGFRPTGLFDNLHRRWMPKVSLSSTWLRFELPRELLPAEPTWVRVDVRVTGPMGRLELSVDGEEGTAPVGVWDNPVGEVSVEIDDPKRLQLEPGGAFYLRIDAGDPARSELTDPQGTEQVSYWQIESLNLQMRLRILDSESASGIVTAAEGDAALESEEIRP